MLDADFLAAIGHPDRLRALVLLEQEPAGARAIAARLGLPGREAEEHLRQLAETGLVDAADGAGDRSGERLWRVRAEGWAELAELLAQVAGEAPGHGV